MRVGLITLGCDKNTVDNEYLAGILEDKGCDVSFIDEFDPSQGLDAVVVTTCGFIDDAKKQSVETLVALAESKRDTGHPRRVFVAGCLAQRYATDLLEEIPELDGLVGVGQFETLTKMVLDSLQTDPQRNAAEAIPKVDIYRFMPRRRADNKPYAFLKVSDGCNHACTFCAIPGMKGKLRSVDHEILVQEAESLVQQGVRELILIAQDLSAYGMDLHTGYKLPQLVNDLCAVQGDFWIRLLYAYPGTLTDKMMDVMASQPKVVPYLDMPLQHLDPEMLRLMKRPYHEVNTVRLVDTLRERIPNLSLRTTMIVGFPGETPRAHQTMLEGIRRMSFNWLGAFQYSKEEGTPAADAPHQVSRATKHKRWQAVMEVQAEITERLNQERIGTRTRVLIEGYDEDREQWFGRSPAEAPEIDGTVFVASDADLPIGEFVEVEITEADLYDVTARPLAVELAAQSS